MNQAGPSYAADLTKYLEIMDELQHSLMMPQRRRTLETCAEALTVVLELYDIDYKIDNR